MLKFASHLFPVSDIISHSNVLQVIIGKSCHFFCRVHKVIKTFYLQITRTEGAICPSWRNVIQKRIISAKFSTQTSMMWRGRVQKTLLWNGNHFPEHQQLQNLSIQLSFCCFNDTIEATLLKQQQHLYYWLHTLPANSFWYIFILLTSVLTSIPATIKTSQVWIEVSWLVTRRIHFDSPANSLNSIDPHRAALCYTNKRGPSKCNLFCALRKQETPVGVCFTMETK